MNDGQLLTVDMLRLVSGTNPDVLNCLLLIKQICATLDEEQCWSKAIKCNNGETLWSMIVQEASKADGNIFSVIKYAIGQINPHLLFTANLAERLFTVAVDEYPLKDIVHLLSNISTDNDILSAIFEYNLARKVRTSSPNSGDFYTPKQVVQLMTELLGIEHGGKVYDPCCGSGAMLCGIALSHPSKKLLLYGQTLDQESFSICSMNLMLHGLSADLGKCPANTLIEDMHADQYFDYILTNPPFNSSDWCGNDTANRNVHWQYGYPPRKNANFAWLQYIISHLSPNGRAVTLLPNGTLTTQNLAESEIRKQILLDGWIEAILALPTGLFYGTKISCCAWVINKSPAHDTVLFVDARQLDLLGQQDGKKISDLLCQYRNDKQLETTQWYAVASIAEIAQKRYVLSPNLYTLPKELSLPSFEQISEDFNTSVDILCNRIPISQLCESIKKWKTKSVPKDWNEVYLSELYNIFGGVCAKKEAFGRGTPMVDVKTVIHHIFLPENLPASVELPDGDAPKYSIKRGDVLLNRTSETIDELACCSVALKDQAAVYGAYLKRLRPIKDDWVDPRYIATYFRSKIYRQEIERCSFVYTTRANINIHQLSMIRLYYPSMTWQHAIGETLSSVIRFNQEHQDMELGELINHFIRAFIDKFVTYPILLFQKGRDE
ncbi:N-6 DNA methylase [[Clostridium] innocuum]|nr:N-6 DNA methylase [[Clostridium] innocuum]MCR0626164.1 N-6 DNA methylase [[Clostridium] innocuum]